MEAQPVMSSFTKRYLDFYYNARIFNKDNSSIYLLTIPPLSNYINLSIWIYESSILSNLSIKLEDDISIISAKFEITELNDVSYISVLAYILELSPPNKNYLVLYRIKISDTSNISIKYFEKYPQDDGTRVTYMKVIGPWIFFCLTLPNTCSSWVSNSIDPMNFDKSNYVSRFFQVDRLTDEDVPWYVSNIFIKENDHYKESKLIINFTEMRTSSLPVFSIIKFKPYRLIHYSFFLVNYEYGNEENPDFGISTLECYVNQFYDVSSSQFCKYCQENEYLLNNECVTSCNSLSSSMNYCLDSTQLSVSNSYNSFMENFAKCSDECEVSKIKRNNLCTSCSGYTQVGTCENNCRYNYISCDGITCHDGHCDCGIGQKYDESSLSCVNDCIVDGYIEAENGTVCRACSNNLYELYHTDCVDADLCPEFYVPLVNAKRNNIKYCKYCEYYIENYECVMECQVRGNVPSGKFCLPCSSGYEKDNLFCSSSCDSNQFSTSNPENGNALYCQECQDQLIFNSQCVDSCTEAGYVPDYTKTFCIICSDNMYELNNKFCVSECPENKVLSLTSNGFKYCTSCDNELVIENGLCVPSCNIFGYVNNDGICGPCRNDLYYDATNDQCNDCNITKKDTLISVIDDSTLAKYCIKCEGELKIENNKCVETCSLGYTYNQSFCEKCKKVLSSDLNMCLEKCESNQIQKYNNILDYYYCSYCSNYILSEECVDECPKNYFIENTNCVLECSKATQFMYNNLCVSSCPLNSIEIYYNVCIEKSNMSNCDNFYGLNDKNECVPCYELDGFLIDKICVKKCSDIYEIITEGSYNICKLKKQDNLCPSFCSSNGDCSILIDGKASCSCFEGYYGSKCNLSQYNSSAVKTEIEELYNNISSQEVENIKYEDIYEIVQLL